MKVACNQPYYYPYAGWFRLFAACDIFVVLDDVQWNRRGYVHRYMSKGKWTTLPIRKTDRETTRIMDMRWRDVDETDVLPIDFIEDSMRGACEELKLPFNIIRSSSLNISSELRGQDRIIAICKKLGATHYINSPGGKELYDVASFEREGIKLTFLPEWIGSYDSVLERLAHESPEHIRQEIYEQI